MFLVIGASIQPLKSQDTLSTQMRAEIRKSDWIELQGNLRGALAYTTVVGCLEIVGGTLFGIGIPTETGGVTAVGFMLGFGGLEMSKSNPIPLTKAKRALISLRSAWTDPAEYDKIYRQVSTAATLGYTSMALAFTGEALVLLGAMADPDTDSRIFLMAAGFTCAGVSMFATIGAGVMSGVARRTLNGQAGSLNLNFGADGIGAAYRLPMH